jgi:hypothetical protein
MHNDKGVSRMTNTSIARVAALAMVSLIIFTATVVLPRVGRHEPSFADALGVSASPLETRLYSQAPIPSAKDLVRSDIVTARGEKMSFDEYGDKTTEDLHFYKDDAHKVATEDYFATLPSGARQRHSEATFNPLSGDPGAEIYKTHLVFRQDSGLPERFGHRLRDGRYEQVYYFEDGATAWRDRYFDSLLNFFTESVYRWNVAHTATYAYAKIVKGDFPGQSWVSLYRENGSRLATLKLSPGSESGTLLGEDGNTVLAEWGQDVQRSFYLLYADNSNEPVKIWNSVTGRTQVTVLDPKTRHVVFQQTWKERPDPSVPDGKRYLLMQAQQFDSVEKPVLKVEMSNNGSHPVQVVVPDKDGELFEDLDDTGTKIVKAQKHDASGVALSSMLSLDRRENFVEIDPKILVMPERPEVVTFNDIGPPRIYDYK